LACRAIAHPVAAHRIGERPLVRVTERDVVGVEVTPALDVRCLDRPVGFEHPVPAHAQIELAAAQQQVITQWCLGDVLDDVGGRAGPEHHQDGRKRVGVATALATPGRDRSVALTGRAGVDSRRLQRCDQFRVQRVTENEAIRVARLRFVVDADDVETGMVVTTGRTTGTTEQIEQKRAHRHLGAPAVETRHQRQHGWWPTR